MYATSGAVLLATWTVSLSPASSAGTFWNLIVMFGCSRWKSAASFFIVGSLPTQDANVTVTGLVGSGTAPEPAPRVVFSLPELLPHAARATVATIAAEAPKARILQLFVIVTDPLPRWPRRRWERSYANRLAECRALS